MIVCSAMAEHRQKYTSSKHAPYLKNAEKVRRKMQLIQHLGYGWHCIFFVFFYCGSWCNNICINSSSRTV